MRQARCGVQALLALQEHLVLWGGMSEGGLEATQGTLRDDVRAAGVHSRQVE